MSVRASLVVAIVLVAVLAGCQDAPPPDPGVTATSSPTPIAVDVPVPVKQVALDCDATLPASQIESVYGFPVPRLEPDRSPIDEAIQQQNGQLSCHWYNETLSVNTFLLVWRDGAVRYAAGSPDLAWDGSFGIPESRMSCSTDASRQCQVHALVGDYLIYAHAGLGQASAPDAEAALHTLFDETFRALAAGPAPERWGPTDADWPLIVDCAALGEAVDPGAVVGVPGLIVEDATGRDEGETEPLPREIAALGGSTRCHWTAPGGGTDDMRVRSVSVTTLSGGAWLWHELLPTTHYSVEALDIPGVDAAALVCDEECSVYVAYGTNVATVDGWAGSAPLQGEDLMKIAGAVAPAIPTVAR